MINLFNIEQGRVVFDLQSLSIPPFRDYWNTHKEEEARKVIEWCVYTYSFHSPYLAYDADVRGDIILRDLGLEGVTDEMRLLGQRFQEFQSSPSIRLLEASRKAAEILIQSLKHPNVGTLKDILDLTKVLKEVGSIVSSLEQSEKIARLSSSDLSPKGRVRGGVKLGLYE